MAKQSSATLSTLASKYAKIKSAELAVMVLTNAEQLTRDIRKLAASVMSQDEKRGQK